MDVTTVTMIFGKTGRKVNLGIDSKHISVCVFVRTQPIYSVCSYKVPDLEF